MARWKKFSPSRESQYSDYNYKNANKIIDPSSPDEMVDSKDYMENDPYTGSYPLNKYDKGNNSSKNSKSSLPMPVTAKMPSLPSISTHSFLDDIKQGLWAGLNEADKGIVSIPKTIWQGASWLTDKLTPDSIYNPKNDLILQDLNKASNYYGDTANETNNKFTNSSTKDKIAYNTTKLIPNAIAMGTEMAIPLPKIGSAGKALSAISEPVEQTVSKLLGTGKVAQYTSKAAKNATEFATLNALTTGANGGSLKDMGKSALQGAGEGALFGVGGKALGDATHYIKGVGNVKKLSDDGINSTVQDEAGNTHTINNSIFNTTAKPIKTEAVSPSVSNEAINEQIPLIKLKEEENKPISEMSKNELFSAIDATKPYEKYKPTETVVDWGDTRGQGKRVGKMVLGGMSNAPTGKKTYVNLVGGVPEYKTNTDDFKGMNEFDKVNYLKAREYGLNHDQSMIYKIVKSDNHGLNDEQIMDRINHYNTNSENMSLPTFNNTADFKGNIKPGNTTTKGTPLKTDLQTFGMNFDINKPIEAMRDNQDIANFTQRTGNEPQSDDYKERQTIVNSFMNSNAIPNEVKQSLKENPDSYKYLQHNNEQTMNQVRNYVDTNYNTAVSHIKNLKSLEDDTDTATAIEIERKLIQEGKFDEAKDWSLRVARLGTKSGQAVQYFSTIKKLTPEWTLNHVQNVVDKSLTRNQREILSTAPKEQIEQIAKNNNIPYLSEEATKNIVDMSKKISELPEGREKDESIYKLKQYAAEQVPKPLFNKVLQGVNNIQTTFMLSSPKTAIRNTVGNGLFAGITAAKNTVKTLLDVPISKVTNERTATLPMPKDYFKGLGEGTKESWLDFKHDVDTSNINGDIDKYELNRINTTKGPLHQLQRVERLALTDRPFETAAYRSEYARQKKLAELNRTKFNEADATEKAKQVSAYNTFKDNNKISNAAVSIKHMLNGGKEWGLGDMIVKFTKTPANIAARAIDYSPVAFFRAVKAGLGKDGFNQNKFTDELSKGITGSGLIALGAGLHKMGVLSTDQEKNKNAKALNEKAGLGDFKINLSGLDRLINGGSPNLQKGDLHISYDWAQPTSVLMALGATLASDNRKGLGKAESILNGFTNGLNSLIDQPMTQGLQKLFAYNDIAGAAQKTIAGIPQTFIPSIVNAFKQIQDNQTRETYDPSLAKQGLNQAITRIPGLEKTLPGRVDVMGDNKQTFQKGSNNILNVLFNPAATTRYLPTPEVEKALNFYNKNGNAEILPKLAQKYVSQDGQKYDLSPEQYIKLQRLMGEGAKRVYDTYSNEQDISSGLTKSNKEARDTIKKDLGIYVSDTHRTKRTRRRKSVR